MATQIKAGEKYRLIYPNGHTETVWSTGPSPAFPDTYPFEFTRRGRPRRGEKRHEIYTTSIHAGNNIVVRDNIVRLASWGVSRGIATDPVTYRLLDQALTEYEERSLAA
jgi:hypothetical protein